LKIKTFVEKYKFQKIAVFEAISMSMDRRLPFTTPAIFVRMRKYEQIGIAKEQEKYNDEKRKFISEYENHHLAEEYNTSETKNCSPILLEQTPTSSKKKSRYPRNFGCLPPSLIITNKSQF